MGGALILTTTATALCLKSSSLKDSNLTQLWQNAPHPLRAHHNCCAPATASDGRR